MQEEQTAWVTLLAVNQELVAARTKSGGDYIKLTVSQLNILVNVMKVGVPVCLLLLLVGLGSCCCC